MSQNHDSFDQSAHGFFVQTPHGDARNGGLFLVWGGSFEFIVETDDNAKQVGHLDGTTLAKIGLNEGFNSIVRDIIEYKGKLYSMGESITTKEDGSGSYGRIAKYDESTGIWGTVGPNGVDFDAGGAGGPKVAVIYNGDLVLAGATGYKGAVLVDDTTTCVGLVKWDGTNYTQMNGGVGMAIICMAVYKAELYVFVFGSGGT